MLFIAFKLKGAERYKQKTLQKKSGGIRELNVPLPKLMRLQKELAKLLQECEQEISAIESTNVSTAISRPRSISHGYKKDHSIATNAHPHRNKKYVFNIDLEDFFCSINFGRVRGFFIKDRRFLLNADVATVIAQIACCNNELPQGGPTSPVISNLVGRILDFKLVNIARENKCYYTRYVDDITFSTGVSEFPQNIATIQEGGESIWVPGRVLLSAIHRSGFNVNLNKTRMQIRPSRQTVTGLVVNKNVNVPKELYKSARSMGFELFMDGRYRFPYISKSARNEGSNPEIISDLRPIESLLGYIHYIKNFEKSNLNVVNRGVSQESGHSKNQKLPAIEALRARLLFYKYFVSNPKPTIICEGKTDNIYLKYAIDRLGRYHDVFKEENSKGELETKIHILKNSRSIIELLGLKGGSGHIKNFIQDYDDSFKKIKHRPLANPVIIIIDNDDGARGIFSIIRQKFNIQINHKSANEFYKLTKNLYLVKTPEKDTENAYSAIEDCFERHVLETTVGGKKLCLVESNFDPEKHYGKEIFSQVVVRSKYKDLNFEGFYPLLDRLKSAIEDYKTSSHC